MKQPCYGCDMRAVGCHSSCKLYLQWKKEWDEKKSLMYEEANKRAIYRDFKAEMIAKENRRHGRKS